MERVKLQLFRKTFLRLLFSDPIHSKSIETASRLVKSFSNQKLKIRLEPKFDFLNISKPKQIK